MKQARRFGVDPTPSSAIGDAASPQKHIQGVVVPSMPQAGPQRPMSEVLRERGINVDDASPAPALAPNETAHETPRPAGSAVTTFHGENTESSAFASWAPVGLPVDLIDPSPWQPRIVFAEAPLSSLADTISDQGINNPIIVRQKADGRYELIAGERRLRSVTLLRKPTILATVRTLDDAEAAILAATDNDAREDLSEFERGRSYRRLLDEGHVKSQQELARRVGRSMASVSRCLSYFKLPPEVVAMLMHDPNLIGNKVVSEFVAFSTEGHSELVIKAITRLRDGKPKPSQEVVLNWLKGEVRRLKYPSSPTPSRVLSASGKSVADIKVDGRKITFTCNKEISPELLLTAIERLLSNAEDNLSPTQD